MKIAYWRQPRRLHKDLGTLNAVMVAERQTWAVPSGRISMEPVHFAPGRDALPRVPISNAPTAAAPPSVVCQARALVKRSPVGDAQKLATYPRLPEEVAARLGRMVTGVAIAFGVQPAAVFGAARPEPLATARLVCMFLAVAVTHLRPRDLGAYFHRHAGSIYHAVKVIGATFL